jgi:hypothetical protein
MLQVGATDGWIERQTDRQIGRQIEINKENTLG